MEHKFSDETLSEAIVGDGAVHIEATNANGTDFIEGLATLRAYDDEMNIRWRLPDRLFKNKELLAGILRELTLEFEERRKCRR